MGELTITTAARRLCRQANSEKVVPGHIYMIDLDTGDIGDWLGGWAYDQPPREWREKNRKAAMRISYGRITQADAQRFLDTLGEGA